MKKEPPVQKRISDLGTGLARQHGYYVETLTAEGRKRAHNITQVPIDLYLAHGWIEHHQWDAGDRLFEDFERSGQTQGNGSFLDETRGGGGQGFTQLQMEARDRWRKAMDSIDGVICQLFVLNVCCYGYMVSNLKHLGVPVNKRMDKLKEALDKLSRYYGIYEDIKKP